MAWGVQHLQRVGAEGDEVAVVQQSAHLWALLGEFHAEEALGLLGQVNEQVFVLRTDFRRQTVLLEDACIAEIMVQVAVGGQQVDGRQLLLGDIALEGAELLLIIASAVDDNTLAGFVAHHVAVFLQGVAHQALDIQHNCSL